MKCQQKEDAVKFISYKINLCGQILDLAYTFLKDCVQIRRCLTTTEPLTINKSFFFFFGFLRLQNFN